MTIFIPSRIRVGFQQRGDTYSNLLAYVIYYDQHNKIRKETSWNNWRHKDIEPQEFDNAPTEGFVLNKKVGGYVSNWNMRQTYCRVYDPRGFEFEITVPNLLYILENYSSIKGKGIEGQLVYAWDGTELLLLPVDTPDYAKAKAESEKVHSATWLKGKDLTPGHTYLTNKGEQWIYLGRFELWDTLGNRWEEARSKGRHYFFAQKYNEWNGSELTELRLETTKSLTRRVLSESSSDIPEIYASLMDELECRREYSPIITHLSSEILDEEGVRNLRYDDVQITSGGERVITRVSYQRLSNTVRIHDTGGRSYSYGRYSKHNPSIEEFISTRQPALVKYYLANGKELRE